MASSTGEGSSASDAVVTNGELIGDPTEGALVVLAEKGGVDPQETRREFPRFEIW